MTHRTPYTTKILTLAPLHDPRHVEAFMRLEYGTLDALGPEHFRREVNMACLCIDADEAAAERLAQSYGL